MCHLRIVYYGIYKLEFYLKKIEKQKSQKKLPDR